MSTLVGRALVKALANVPSTDTKWDAVLDSFRESVSRQVEEITGKIFDVDAAAVEFHQSWEQSWGDPSPQYLWTRRTPITSVAELVWASFDDHDENGAPLVEGTDWEFQLDPNGDRIGLRVQRFGSFPNTLPIPAGGTSLLLTSPTGFRITYAGGAAVSATGDTDPVVIGEEDVVGVKAALQTLVALKIVDNFKQLTQDRAQESSALVRAAQLRSSGLILPWTDEEKKTLLPYTRADLAWTR